MELNDILNKLDSLFEDNKIDEVEPFLRDELKKALENEMLDVAVSLLNEMMGFFRETSQWQKAYECIEAVFHLMDTMGLKGSAHYGISLVNAANAYRAGGEYEKSLEMYIKAQDIYKANFSDDDSQYAALYNNLSLLYQETGDYNKAKETLYKSLSIIDKQPDSKLEQAVTRTNLASSLIQLREYKEAERLLREALYILEKNNIKDVHYCGALSSYGLLLYMQERYSEAADFFIMAASRIKVVLGGETEQYKRIMENYNAAVEKCGKEKNNTDENDIKGIDLCRSYYEAYGISMIREKFPGYKNRIAVGLAGEGSDCFGFDDKYSTDHDWGPGFCMWLTDEDYEKIGAELKKAYDELPKEYMGFRRINTPQGGGRVGVRTIKEFFTKLLGTNTLPEDIFSEEKNSFEKFSMNKFSTENFSIENENKYHDDIAEKINWLAPDEERLAAAVNGQVFKDDLGIFSNIRKLLKEYYPMDIRYLKLAESAALYAQTGQYNFKRMLDRGDTVAAAIEAMKGVKEALKLINLINGQYCCHDKWLFKGANFSGGFEMVPSLLQKISENAINPANVSIFEEISTIITKRLYADNYISDEDTFMHNHVRELLTKSQYYKMSSGKLVETIIKTEFDAFDKVKNKGGRAECQDDFNTFNIMRKSQYILWSKEMLIQYLYEFTLSLNHGRNMIEEKYGRMMKYTAPEEYDKIKDSFPAINVEKERIIDVIVAIQTNMMSDFAKRYPRLALNARSVSSDEDNLYNTSSQTYLKGEISTYSDKMLELYGRFVADMQEQGKNISEETIRNTVILYGYKSLDEAEKKI